MLIHAQPSAPSPLDARNVIAENLCIGCGACTAVSAHARIAFNPYGELQADLKKTTPEQEQIINQICPFSNASTSESQIAQQCFADESLESHDDAIGFFRDLYAGYATKERPHGSSGGIVTWLLTHLLEQKIIDYAIVVGRTENNDRFFDFKVISDPQNLLENATSFYYPVSYDRVLRHIQNNPGRYAITGVPCFHKALRQLRKVDPIIDQRITFQIGIVCGQMKSSLYLEYLDRKAGKSDNSSAHSNLLNANFRRKDETARADEYRFESEYRTTSGQPARRSVHNRDIGANWGMGFFKPLACDFCDDVFAETADIAVMDAWIPPYIQDGRGTSLIISRSRDISHHLQLGKNSQVLHLEPTTTDQLIESQRGGLNHRRMGLQWRLQHWKGKSERPQKRVTPSGAFNPWIKIEQILRSTLRIQSRDAMRAQITSGRPGLDLFHRKMFLALQAYRWFLRLKSRCMRATTPHPL